MNINEFKNIIEKEPVLLTKREYFALQIFLKQPNYSNTYITRAVEQADKLLAELGK